jgi:predicted RNA-binding Zn-ribbon protein involved in translation (DUF1610 family)
LNPLFFYFNANSDLNKKDGHLFLLFEINSFRHLSSVHRHAADKHDGMRYPCPDCAYVTGRADNLKLHHAALHQGAQYTCRQCSYSAKRRSTLRHHVAAKHLSVSFKASCF